MSLRKIKNFKSFEKCRTCSHSYISHTDYTNQPYRCQNMVSKVCKCEEFLSKDNLEFLEQMYDKCTNKSV
jgi:hypothetical protein